MGIIQTTELKQDNIELIGNQLAENLTAYIEEELLDMSFTSFWILLSGNIILMVLTVKLISYFYGS